MNHTQTPQPLFLSSRQNEAVVRAAKLHDKKGRSAAGLFCFEGIKLFSEALQSGLRLCAVFYTEQAQNAASALFAKLPRDCALYCVSESVYEKLSLERAPQGVFIVAEDLPLVRRADEYIPQPGEGAPRVFLADSLQDAGNVGTLIRTASALGFARLCFFGSAELTNPRTLRAAMGALFRQRIDLCSDMARYIASLRACGAHVYAAMPRRGAAMLGKTAFPQGTVFLVGNEGHGLPDSLVDACDGTVQIPMAPHSESLNAATAAALLLWESVRGEGSLC